MRRPDHEPKRAFFSVADKTGIERIAARLVALGYEIDSSGGTCKYLRMNGFSSTRNVNAPLEREVELARMLLRWGVPSHNAEGFVDDWIRDVSRAFPEPDSDIGLGMPMMLDHRVATLGAPTHGGLLALATPEHDAERKLHGVPWYDIVFVDFYPFAKTIAKPGIELFEAVEQIDIGGPTLVKSGAKGDRMVVCDPADRERVLTCLEQGTPEEQDALRTELRAKAFYTVSKYYGDVARYMGNGKYLALFGEMVATCKYGENPHQQFAALYSDGSDDPLALHRFKFEPEEPPSSTTFMDVDRAVETIVRIAATFEANHLTVPHIAVGVKHGNVCGAAVADTSVEAARKMVEGDPLALFGGVVVTNFAVSESVAEMFVEHKGDRVLAAVVAPGFLDSARPHLVRKTRPCHLFTNEALFRLGKDSIRHDQRVRQVRGGYIAQDGPEFLFTWDHPDVVVRGALTEKCMRSTLLAKAVCDTSNSNTITLVKDEMVIANATGRQSRVGAAKLALMIAGDTAHDPTGAVVASDSFFIATDAVEALAEAGVKYILTTSGSKLGDEKVIKYCEEKGVTLAMIPDKVARGFSCH